MRVDFTPERIQQLESIGTIIAPMTSEDVILFCAITPGPEESPRNFGEIHEEFVEKVGHTNSTHDIANLGRKIKILPEGMVQLHGDLTAPNTPRLRVQRTINGNRSLLFGMQLINHLAPLDIPIRHINPAASRTGRGNLNLTNPGRNRLLAYHYMRRSTELTVPGLVQSDTSNRITPIIGSAIFKHLRVHALVEPLKERGPKGLVRWQLTGVGNAILKIMLANFDTLLSETLDLPVDEDRVNSQISELLQKQKLAKLVELALHGSGHYETGDAPQLHKTLTSKLHHMPKQSLTIADMQAIIGDAYHLTAVKLDRLFKHFGDNCILKPEDGLIVDQPSSLRRWTVRPV